MKKGNECPMHEKNQCSVNFYNISTRFGKLVKTQGKLCCILKPMGIHFPHPIFMSIFEKK